MKNLFLKIRNSPLFSYLLVILNFSLYFTGLYLLVPKWFFILVIFIVSTLFVWFFVSALKLSAQNAVTYLQDDKSSAQDSWMNFYSSYTELVLHRASHFGGFSAEQAESLHSIITAYSYDNL